MKRFFTSLICIALAFSFAGCSKTEQKATALQLMKEVNDSNILHEDTANRLWYQVETPFFADGDDDGIGDLNGVMDYIGYISDGDVNTSRQDLNMNGLYIDQLIQTDNTGSITDYYVINPAYGDAASLSKLTSKCKEEGIDVMITLNLDTISRQSTYFDSLAKAAVKAGKDAKVEDIDYEYAGMFYLSDKKENDKQFPIEGSPFYYQGLSADQPLINQNDANFRKLISNVVSYYMGLGVNAFAIPDIDQIDSDPKKTKDILQWFAGMVHEQNSAAIICATTSSYQSDLNGLDLYIAQNDFAGADGYISKGVTGAMDALELADQLEKQNEKAAYFLTSATGNMDLIKSESRQRELKMALAILMMMSGQVFVSSGDEIGLSDDEVDLITDALKEDQGESADLELTFGSLEEQRSDENSILNFFAQAVLLRNSYAAVSGGKSTINKELTTESVLALNKDLKDSSCIVVFNLGSEPQSCDISKITIHGLPAELGGVLLSGDEPASIDGQSLNLPAYSTVILK